MSIKTSAIFIAIITLYAYGQPQCIPVENHFIYGNPTDKVEGYLEKTFYQEAVKNLPIICIDIVVVDLISLEYLLVLRDNEPCKGLFWVPGGRLYKGESFFEATKRKCKEETDVEVQPLSLLSANSLLFKQSAWGCTTHTPTVGVVALINKKQVPHTDKHHSSFLWVSIFEPHQDPYVDKLRTEALQVLNLS